MHILKDFHTTMFEEASAPTIHPSLATAWTDRLAAVLAADAGGVYAPALEWLRRNGFAPTPPFKPAAVLIALVEQETGPGVLLTRRHDELAQHGGQVAFPGGAVEAGDASAERTALREAEEEVALVPERVRLLGRLPCYPTTTGYLVTPIVGHVAGMPTLQAQPEEVADIFVLPFTVLLNPARWQTRPLGDGVKRLMLPELSWQGQRIWGATAGMLQLLLDPLRTAWRES
ncbi:MAG: NUDIX hydrolase [Gammaproteobacteria bacterium]